MVITPSVYRIFWVNFTQNINKDCLNNYQNLFQDIPDYPINKNQHTKKSKAITVLNKEGGGEGSAEA